MSTRKSVPIMPTIAMIDSMVAAMTMASGYEYPKKLVIAAYQAGVSAAPVELPSDQPVTVDKEGVRFGKWCWISHEKITGCEAALIPAKHKQYYEWFLANLSKPADQHSAISNGDGTFTLKGSAMEPYAAPIASPSVAPAVHVGQSEAAVQRMTQEECLHESEYHAAASLPLTPRTDAILPLGSGRDPNVQHVALELAGLARTLERELAGLREENSDLARREQLWRTEWESISGLADILKDRAEAAEREVARLRLPPEMTLSDHPGCVHCMEAGTQVRPGEVCPKCGDRSPTQSEREVAELKRENESLRAECGLRQIRGYHQGLERGAKACDKAVTARLFSTPADALDYAAATIRAIYNADIAASTNDLTEWVEISGIKYHPKQDVAAEIERLRADAERYQVVRNADPSILVTLLNGESGHEMISPEELDQFCDAASKDKQP